MSELIYASLHNHTAYSNLKLIDSINSVDGLIDYGYELGLYGIAITDHDCLTAHVPAIKHFNKKYKDAERPYKLVLGNEIYITREGLCKETHQAGEKFYHCILLAKDSIGHEQLRKLSSRAWERSYMMAIMRTPTYLSDLDEIVGENPGHLVCTTACIGGYCGAQFLNARSLLLQSQGFYGDPWDDINDIPPSKRVYTDKLPAIDNYLAGMAALFGDDFYIELQPSFQEDQIQYNRYMMEHYWGKYNFTIATDAHYLKKDESKLHKDFLQSKEGGGNREVDSFYSAAYLMSADEVYEYVQDYMTKDEILTMFKNSCDIVDKCSGDYNLFHEQIVPKIEYEWVDRDPDSYYALQNAAKHHKDKYPNLYQWYNGDVSESDEYLAYLVAEGFFSGKIDPCEEYLARLDEEYYHINKISERLQQPLTNYFNTMAKIIDIVWSDGDSIVGPGRGSGCGSLINYLVGITQLDPLRQELQMPFWRFLNESKVELPDIDFDTEAAKRNKIFNAVSRYFNSINSEVINVCTIGTLGTKSAIRTAGKGLNIEDVVINYIVSLVPTERGKDWTLDQCMYGDDEHTKISQFISQMKMYPQLWKLSKRIEGLVTNLSVHASGVLILNGKVTDHNSVMKTSRGVRVTAWDLHDSEEMGALKYDFLTVQALDKIRTTMNLLLEDRRMEWQGSLRETYDKYLLPKNIDYTNQEMWHMAGNGEILELFQFDTAQGSKAVRLIKPTSIKDLAAGNSVMRLMCDGEQPLDIFVRHKRQMSDWYREMDVAGLNQEEQALMEKYLANVYGVAGSQEIVMQLSMDPHISGFSVPEANKLRKGIAKKVPAVIEETRQLFYRKGQELGTRVELLDYIWNRQIGMSLGYSFSDLHTVAYSTIALQEMNLSHKFPLLYWNCACLSVNANAINEEDYEFLVDEEILELTDEEDEKKSSKVAYDKIAAAIGKFKNTLTIVSPDINKAKMGFIPNVENNTIMFGLKGISLVGDDIVKEIIARRPYSGVQDFVNKMRDGNKTLIAKNKVVNLIKAGCFDAIEQKPRVEIMKDFIGSLTPKKEKLNLNNFLMLIRNNLVPPSLDFEKGVYLFTKEIRKQKDGNGFYTMRDEDNVLYLWYVKWIGKEPPIIDGEYRLKVSEWDSYYNSKMDNVRNWIKKDMDNLIERLHEIEYSEEWNKYCNGDVLQWELDSLNFYHSGHPLTNKEFPIEVDSIDDLKENDFDGFWNINGEMVPKMVLHSIAGTVLVKDKKANIVVLSTPDGVIKVKIYKAQFAKYDKVTEDEEGNVIEDSFLDKGNHLLITGILRDEMFIPKVYKNTPQPPILKIVLDENNNFVGFNERK